MSGFDRNREHFYIGGKWVAPTDRRPAHVISPSSEDVIGYVPQAAPPDIDAAVAAARSAFDQPGGWGEWPVAERAAALYRLAEELEARGDDSAELMVEELGMPIRLATTARTTRSVDLLRYYADLAVSTWHDSERSSSGTVIRWQPVGVVAAIVPYNGPLTLTMFKAAPALAAGCSIVVKPSPAAPLALYLLAEAAERAALPPGVFNIVSGDGAAGEHLVAHPWVDKVAFTGSTAIGRSIAHAAAEQLRPVTLELGGKSAAVLLPDVDLGAFAERIAGLSFTNAGQNCFCHSRILAPRERYDEVVERVRLVAEAVEVGDPHSSTTQMGPLISADHRARVEGYIAAGVAQGARLVTGGARPPDQERGFYMAPTVFADVDNSMTIAQEEIFGPVVAIIPYDTEDDAVRLANDSVFGLAGSVWSEDLEHAERVARRLDVGTVGINNYVVDFAAPFGGRRMSGLGYELGPQGLAAYAKLQSLYRDERNA